MSTCSWDWLVIITGCIGLLYGIINAKMMLDLPCGNAKMQEIASAIQEGASAYLDRQYRTIAAVGFVCLEQVGRRYAHAYPAFIVLADRCLRAALRGGKALPCAFPRGGEPFPACGWGGNGSVRLFGAHRGAVGRCGRSRNAFSHYGKHCGAGGLCRQNGFVPLARDVSLCVFHSFRE